MSWWKKKDKPKKRQPTRVWVESRGSGQIIAYEYLLPGAKLEINLTWKVNGVEVPMYTVHAQADWR